MVVWGFGFAATNQLSAENHQTRANHKTRETGLFYEDQPGAALGPLNLNSIFFFLGGGVEPQNVIVFNGAGESRRTAGLVTPPTCREQGD